MKTVFLSWLPWALVVALGIVLAASLVTLAYLFSFLMSGAWYRWKHKGALKEREVLYEVREKIRDRKTGDALASSDCDALVRLIDEMLVP